MGSSGGKLFLYDTPEYKIPCSAAPNLRQIDSGCTGTVVLRHYDALPSGGIAPQSVLHIVFAFLSAVLVLLYLLWIIRTRYQTEPGAYRPFLYGWGAIVGVSVILLAVAGIISSALEIYVTLTSVAMAQRLACRVAVQEEMPDSGGNTSAEGSRGKSLGKRRNHLLT